MTVARSFISPGGARVVWLKGLGHSRATRDALKRIIGKRAVKRVLWTVMSPHSGGTYYFIEPKKAWWKLWL